MELKLIVTLSTLSNLQAETVNEEDNEDDNDEESNDELNGVTLDDNEEEKTNRKDVGLMLIVTKKHIHHLERHHHQFYPLVGQEL